MLIIALKQLHKINTNVLEKNDSIATTLPEWKYLTGLTSQHNIMSSSFHSRLNKTSCSFSIKTSFPVVIKYKVSILFSSMFKLYINQIKMVSLLLYLIPLPRSGYVLEMVTVFYLLSDKFLKPEEQALIINRKYYHIWINFLFK